MIPSITSLVSKYGLIVVGVGTLVEGETVLLAAGALASRRLLNLVAVYVVAAVGAWLGHVVWFAVGRLVGRQRIISLVPRWERPVTRIDALIRRRPWACIFSLQYLYGMRVLGAVALGLSSLPVGWFLAAEALNCLIWAGLVATLGYAIGASAAHVLQWSVRGVWMLLGVIILSAVIHRLLHSGQDPHAGAP